MSTVAIDPAAVPALTPEVAEAKIQAVYADAAHPYHDGSHLEHPRAVDEMAALFRAAHPDAALAATEVPGGGQSAPPPESAVVPSDEALTAFLPPLPEGEWHPETVRDFQEVAREFTLPADEVTGWLRYYAERVKAMQEGAPPADQAQTAAMFRPEEVTAARLVYARLPHSIQQQLEVTRLGDDPRVIRRFVELGRPLMDAQAALAKIENDPTHAYWRGDDPVN